MAKQIIGWVLLLAGVLVIVWGIWSSIGIFTGKKPVPEIFKSEDVQEVGVVGSEEVPEDIQKLIREQFAKIIPPKFLNLISWSMLIAILVFAAGKIAGLGIHLLASNNRV